METYKVNLREISDKQKLLLTQLSYLDFDIEKYEKIRLSGKKITISDLEDVLCDPDNSYLGFDTTSEGKNFKLATQREIIQQLREKNLGNLIVIDIEKKDGTPFKAIAIEDDFKGRGMAYNGTDFVKISQDVDDNLPLYIKESPELIEYAKIFFDKNKGIDNYLYGHAVGGNMAMHVYIENYECVSGIFTMNATVIEREPNTIDPPQMQRALCNEEKNHYCRTRGAYVGEYEGVADPYEYNIRYVLSEKSKDSLLENLIPNCIMFDKFKEQLDDTIVVYAQVMDITDNFIHIVNSEGMVNNGCKPVPKRKNPNDIEKEESDVSKIIHDVVRICKDTVVKVGKGILEKISDIILNIWKKKHKTLTDGTDHESDGANEFKEKYKIDEIFWGEGLKLIQEEEKENKGKKEENFEKDDNERDND